jgi:hypothetical protein
MIYREFARPRYEPQVDVNIFAVEIRGCHRELEKAPRVGHNETVGSGREQDCPTSNLPWFPDLQRTTELGFSSAHKDLTQRTWLQTPFAEGE